MTKSQPALHLTLTEPAFVGDGRILTNRVHMRVNLGGYNRVMGHPIQTEWFSRVLMGCDKVLTIRVQIERFCTNTTQDVGVAISDQVVHDQDGQVLTASFVDYTLPRASDMPMIGITAMPVLSAVNPMGINGFGEAGIVGAMANVGEGAIRARGIRQVDMPFTPMSLGSIAKCLCRG